MTVDVSIGNLLSTCMLGIIAWYVRSVKSEITSLRDDIRKERDARGVIEVALEGIKARCAERHKNE